MSEQFVSRIPVPEHAIRSLIDRSAHEGSIAEVVVCEQNQGANEHLADLEEDPCGPVVDRIYDLIANITSGGQVLLTNHHKRIYVEGADINLRRYTLEKSKGFIAANFFEKSYGQCEAGIEVFVHAAAPGCDTEPADHEDVESVADTAYQYLIVKNRHDPDGHKQLIRCSEDVEDFYDCDNLSLEETEKVRAFLEALASGRSKELIPFWPTEEFSADS